MQNKTASIDAQLYLLFDFQRFMQNKELAAEIEDADASARADLSEDDLSLLSAAGIDGTENRIKNPEKPE